MWLKRMISPKNRISIPQDIMEQMNLKVGETIYMNIKSIDGEPVIVIKGESKNGNT